MADTVEYTQEKVLKQLRTSFEMYENTKKSTEKRMREAINQDGTKKYTKEDIEKELELITDSQQDIINAYIQSGGNPEDLKSKSQINQTSSM